MPTIDPTVSNYIDIAIARERAIFNADMDKKLDESRHVFLREVRIEREIIQDDIRKIAEMVSSKPGREEVRDIVREEIGYELRPIKAELSMYREELLDHRQRIAHIEQSL